MKKETRRGRARVDDEDLESLRARSGGREPSERALDARDLAVRRNDDGEHGVRSQRRAERHVVRRKHPAPFPEQPCVSKRDLCQHETLHNDGEQHVPRATQHIGQRLRRHGHFLG